MRFGGSMSDVENMKVSVHVYIHWRGGLLHVLQICTRVFVSHVARTYDIIRYDVFTCAGKKERRKNDTRAINEAQPLVIRNVFSKSYSAAVKNLKRKEMEVYVTLRYLT